MAFGWARRHPRVLLVTSLVLGSSGLLGWYLLLWADTIRVPDRIPDGFSAIGFSHESFGQLLQRFVTEDGTVRYGDWHDDASATSQFDRYLAALARYSPENAPERFGNDADRLAYWLNAYNACVIKGVLAHWPIRSVQDVKAPVEFKAGLGFFWRTHFILGGRSINLYHLEHDVIRARFDDARVHFALNCASAGCPPLRPTPPTGPGLERFLARAAHDFVHDPRNVAVDHGRKLLSLSSIFEWYREDFLAELARRKTPGGQHSLRDWLLLIAEGDLKTELERARSYTIRFRPYDWRLNSALTD